MFDLDHFKRINDTKGHPFGDFVLCTVAKLLRKHLNRADVLCRYGGEEFCAVLNHVNAQEARSVAERLNALIRASHFMSPEGEETTLTMSIGVSSVWNATSRLTLDELIDQADRALYEAKASGRDRVCVYEA
jgi:diguanylate cyclase (GGDEF)-like protein